MSTTLETTRQNQTQKQGVPAFPRPTQPAYVIENDAEAISIAEQLAKDFAQGSAERDQTRTWPIEELDAFSQSGLWSINVPKRFGGPEVSYAILAKVVEIISAADSSIGQISQNHLGVVAAIRTVSDEPQQKLLFNEVLRGTRFGNAFSEFGSKRAVDFETKFTDAGDHVIVNGQKFYSTGALLAHLVPIVALDDEGRAWYAIAERDAPGLTVIDDWSSFGQRTTLSGTVLLDNVKVPKTYLVPGYKGYDQPTTDGAVFQIIQVAVDTGIAKAAIDETVAFVRSKSRPWVDSGLDHAWQDPYTIQAVGDLTLRLHAAQALLEKAGHPNFKELGLPASIESLCGTVAYDDDKFSESDEIDQLFHGDQVHEDVFLGIKRTTFLIGTDGPFHNVLKIRPPMPFNADDADTLLKCLDDALARSAAE